MALPQTGEAPGAGKDHMIWLASFPRSGNTFFRVVLHEVYGIESGEFHNKEAGPNEEGYEDYPVVKTHLLPSELVPPNPDIPAVYLVRDGRDAIVSMAHQRKDLIEWDSNYENNMHMAILAEGGSYFGGWSKNVSEWIKRASVIIKFEDLIKKPIECVERIRHIIDLPDPMVERLPTFRKLKKKKYDYTSGEKLGFPVEEIRNGRKKFFRRGKVGAWKDEMPSDIQQLFWQHHGKVMKELGYTDGMPDPMPIAETTSTARTEER